MTEETENDTESPRDDIPTSVVQPAGARTIAWILPVLALGLAVFLTVTTLGRSGVGITVRASEGHGIKVGDTVRYRGIIVGTVDEVGLASDLHAVVLEVRLDPAARTLARRGSRFWVVRPDLSLDSVQGLETVVGARYIAVLPGPGEAAPQYEFDALADAPVSEFIEPGGVEISLEAPSRFGLAPGAPVNYRQIQVGTVLSVGLSNDSTAVEFRAYIRPAFAQLVREDTRFWEDGGIEFDLSLLGGLNVDFGSMRSLLVGGISMATPQEPGEPVLTGHRFILHPEPDDEWLEWRPALPIGSSLLPVDTPLPPLLRANLSWKKKGFFGSEKERHGWVLPGLGGLVGPADLLQPDAAAVDGSSRLEVAGEAIPIDGGLAWEGGSLARLDADPGGRAGWPADRTRPLGVAEDSLVFGDPAAPPMALSATRLEVVDGEWIVDDALSFDPSWHGACVLAREDGYLIGILLVSRDAARVVAYPRAE